MLHCYRRKHRSLAEKQNILKNGEIWKRATKDVPNAFKNPKIKDLQIELKARNQSTLGLKKPQLEEILNDTLEGVQRLPDLLFFKPTQTLEDINCSKWEVSYIEFMHDFLQNVTNTIDEMPLHIKNVEAKKKIVNLFKDETKKGFHNVSRL